MAAKVYKRGDGSWWIRTHHAGKKAEKRFGPSKRDKAQAEKVAEQINAMIALGTFGKEVEEASPRAAPCDKALGSWLATHQAELKPTTRSLYKGLAENHLIPHFQSMDLAEIDSTAIRAFVDGMILKGKAPGTTRNALALLRLVANSLIRQGQLDRNPVVEMKALLKRVRNATETEVEVREAWSRDEAEILLDLAWQHEQAFAPLLEILFGTGMRRGEALGLKWQDVDFDERKLLIRRSINSQGQSTPKTGRARRVVLSERLVEMLFDLLGERQRQRISESWPETPEWIFCNQRGGASEPRNVSRVWERVRRRAESQGVRKLALHSARHSWATWALQAGKNPKWVADQLGHADPSTTLKHYAHAMPEDDFDVSFTDLDVTRRHYASPGDSVTTEELAKYANSWHAGRDSNPRPSGSKPDALSS